MVIFHSYVSLPEGTHFQNPIGNMENLGGYHLVMTNTLPWKMRMTHRNRWFSELKNGDLPWLC